MVVKNDCINYGEPSEIKSAFPEPSTVHYNPMHSCKLSMFDKNNQCPIDCTGFKQK